MWGKKSSEKSAKKRFLYSHKYRDQKMGGKNRAKHFFQKHTNTASKICWEKIVGKKYEKTFLYSHEYRDQKMEKKNPRNNISRDIRIVRARN